MDKLLEDASKKDLEGQLEIINAMQEDLVIRRIQLVYTIGEV